jgi:hypothetical protein
MACQNFVLSGGYYQGPIEIGGSCESRGFAAVPPEAITELTKGRLLRGDDHAKVAADEIALRKAVAAQGAAGFWHEIRKWNEGDYPNVGEFDVPQAYARLGEKEKAMVLLERNFEKRAPLVTLLKVDPALDTLRSDPRFEDLLRRMNLPQ